MSLPFETLTGSLKGVGYVVAVLIGFGFGFALERSGFGRANKLAGQFYGYDMTVFKVMFSAIVTAALGLAVFSGLGLVDLKTLSEGAASGTFVWPMAIGGFMLGVGFIVSGYCPGTSMVATASGNLDGFMTLAGVVLGSVVYAEVYPAIEGFASSSALGQTFLYDLLGIPAAALAVGVAIFAVLAFMGAEKVEKIMAKKFGHQPSEVDPEPARAPRRVAFGLFGASAAAAVAFMLFVPVRTEAEGAAQVDRLSVETFARRYLAEPWSMRVVDLRDKDACAKMRIPGAECVPAEELGALGLQYSPARRDLVLLGDGPLAEAPAEARRFPGRVFLLEGGWKGWSAFALEPPEVPAPGAPEEALEAYRFRAGLNKAFTGREPPPPPAPVKGFVPKKKKGGGCG